MGNKRIINITDVAGNKKPAEVLLFFTMPTSTKDYIIYTYHENDKNMELVYISSLKKENDNYFLETLTDENEWQQVKDIMRKIVVDNANK